MIVTQDNIAPAITPVAIIGIVILKNVFSFEAPKLMDASSIVIGICCNIATEDRIVYGILRMTRAITIIKTVPVSTNGCLLNAITSPIPTTDPGMIYGTMLNVSTTLLTIFGRRTTKYAINTAINIVANSANPPI